MHGRHRCSCTLVFAVSRDSSNDVCSCLSALLYSVEDASGSLGEEIVWKILLRGFLHCPERKFLCNHTYFPRRGQSLAPSACILVLQLEYTKHTHSSLKRNTREQEHVAVLAFSYVLKAKGGNTFSTCDDPC